MATTPYKKVVAQDVADALGVSLCTVNRSLSGKPGVSEARRRQVQEKARELGYMPDSVAQILARNPITIGVLSNRPTTRAFGTYHHDIIAGMEAEFAKLEQYKIKKAFYLIAKGETLDVGDFMKWVDDNKVEALCLGSKLPIRYAEEVAEITARMKERGVPLFIEGGGIEITDEIVSLVEVDAEMSGRMAADFFYCMEGDGLRAIVLVGSFAIPNLERKADSFCDQLRQYGVGDVCAREMVDSRDSLPEAVRQIVEEGYTCIYDASGYCHLIGEALEEMGMTDRVKVIGTDYIPEDTEYHFKSGLFKALFQQNAQEIGRKIVRVAYDYLVNSRTFGMENWLPPKRILIQPTFCMRSYFLNKSQE